MSNFAYISGNPDNLTGGGAANMVDIQGPLVDLATWLNTDLQPRVAAAVPTFVTSLPTGATDGQEIYYQADATNGVIWHLRYNAGSASAYKWEFVGGSDIVSRVETAEGTASTTYVDLATVGPSVTVPLAGDYSIELSAILEHTTASAFMAHSVQVGATLATDNDWQAYHAGVANQMVSGFRWMKKTGLAASTVLTSKYRVSGATGTARNRGMRVRPIRVG